MKRSLLLPIFMGFIVVSILLLITTRKEQTLSIIPAEPISLEEVAPEARDTQYMLNHLVRGYIIDQINNAITVQTDQFIASGQEIEFKLSSSQTVFCWPSKQNGIDISKSFLTLPEGSNLYLKNEIETTFNQLAKLENKYALIQIDNQGAISKLVIISCFND